MSKKNNVHVVPHPEGWAAKRPNSDRASSLHPTQKAAIEAGRNLAKKSGSELLIHGEDGQIREKNSYGNDSFPAKG